MPTRRSARRGQHDAESGRRGLPGSRRRRPRGTDAGEPSAPRLHLGRSATDEVRDVGRADEDGVDARPLEREHVVPRRRRAGRRSRACRRERRGAGRGSARAASRRPRPRAARAGRSRGRSARATPAATPRRGRRRRSRGPSSTARCVQLLEIAPPRRAPRRRSGRRRRRLARGLRRGVDAEEDRQRRRLAQMPPRASTQRERLRRPAPRRCRAPSASRDERDDRDSVSLRDRLAEASRRRSLGGMLLQARQVPIGCQTVFSSRKAAISHGLCPSAGRGRRA